MSHGLHYEKQHVNNLHGAPSRKTTAIVSQAVVTHADAFARRMALSAAHTATKGFGAKTRQMSLVQQKVRNNYYVFIITIYYVFIITLYYVFIISITCSCIVCTPFYTLYLCLIRQGSRRNMEGLMYLPNPMSFKETMPMQSS